MIDIEPTVTKQPWPEMFEFDHYSLQATRNMEQTTLAMVAKKPSTFGYGYSWTYRFGSLWSFGDIWKMEVSYIQNWGSPYPASVLQYDVLLGTIKGKKKYLNFRFSKGHLEQ